MCRRTLGIALVQTDHSQEDKFQADRQVTDRQTGTCALPRYAQELEALAAKEGVADRVTFRRSPSDAEKGELLAEAVALVYTPTNEHFGIVRTSG